MGGHLFLVHGDLTRLACDAWLLPTDSHRNVVPHWYQDEVGPVWRPAKPDAAWLAGDVRVERVVDWSGDVPRPWLANVGRMSADPRWYVEAVQQFLQKTSESHERYLTGRAKKLVALPVVGAGEGGGYAMAGKILEVLVPTLRDDAAKLNLDVALVMRDAAVYAAAVQTRRQIQGGSEFWEALHATERVAADRLAKRAADGDLVVFLGAGASRGANLPTWSELLERLLNETGAAAGISDETRAEYCRLPPLDQARWLELRLARAAGPVASGLGQAVQKVLSEFRHPSLCHFLLAALPVREFVTTNYDTLFERAAQGSEQPLRVIPYAPSGGSRRWLLKMHGCVEHPSDIVLTRGDFLRYDDQRSALRGIVQAMLMTKHMLFVGFSLNDDNFHRIAEDVRKALRGSGRGDAGKMTPFGTMLSLERATLARELWSNDLDWHELDRTDQGSAEAARRLEVFLDYLAAESGLHQQHLSERRFDSVLTTGERELRGMLDRLRQELNPAVRETPAWRELERFLSAFGYR